MNKDFLIPYFKNFVNDEPVELFEGLNIYPILMRDYIEFTFSLGILKINKNKIKDPAVISMSYLEYIIYLIEKEKEGNSTTIFESMLASIISLCTRDKKCKIFYGKDNKNKIFLSINNVRLYKKDFDLFRKFVLCQNIPDYDENYINPELEEELDKAEQIKNGNKKKCNIEKQMVAMTIDTSLTIEDIKKMTIRKFFIASEMVDKRIHYQIYKTASASGFVKFEKEIPHYLIEDEYTLDDKVIDYSQFKNKITKTN